MNLRALGTSGGLPTDQGTMAFHLPPTTLLDAGTGVQHLEQDALDSLSDVFITHAHMDHVAGLPLLVDALFDTLTREQRTLTVRALPYTIDALRAHIFNDQLWPDFTALPSHNAPVLRFHPLTLWDSIPVTGDPTRPITLTPFPLGHSIPTCGFLIREGETRIAVCGDTGLSQTSIDALNQLGPLDQLYIECALSNEREALAAEACHLTPVRLTALLDALRVLPERIGITHLKPSLRSAIVDELKAALPTGTGWELV